MSEEYVGPIVMEVDGDEIDIVSLNVTRDSLRKPVKTMNRNMKVKGFVKLVRGYALKVTAIVTKGKPTKWDDIEGAKISIESEDGSNRESYLDCGTISVGQSYEVEGESRVDIEMYALDFIQE